MSEIPVEAHIDDVHAHPRHTGHRWFDITLAVTAIFISMISLYVAVQHGHTERDLVAASSWPFPQAFMTDNYEGRGVAFGVINAGTGPAKIYSVQLTLDGRPVSSPVDLLAQCCGAPASRDEWRRLLPEGSIQMGSIDSSVLRPGERTEMLVLRRTGHDQAIVNRLDSALGHVGFKVCYCSVLDECWTSELRTLNAKSVKVCEPPAYPYRFSDLPS